MIHPLKIQAPAKLNLFLEVLQRRNDGFHELETLMVPITIFDSITFSSQASSQIRLDCGWVDGSQNSASNSVRQFNRSSFPTADAMLGDVPEGTNNIVVKAVEELRQQAQVESGAWIRLHKRIPSAAGLGGASSDAAAVLLAANQAWRLGWRLEQLRELAATIGSDVPFFLNRCAAWCRGRGEKITLVTKRMPLLHFVVVRPPAGLSTPQVFRECSIPQAPIAGEALESALHRGEFGILRQLMINRLQEPAEELSPWIRRLRDIFQTCNCYAHQMTGSGSSYFGICRNRRHANRTAARIKSLGTGRVFVATNAVPTSA